MGLPKIYVQVGYDIGGGLQYLLDGTDTALNSSELVRGQTSFRATVGQSFEVAMKSISSTSTHKTAADVILDIHLEDLPPTGGGGGGPVNPPTGGGGGVVPPTDGGSTTIPDGGGVTGGLTPAELALLLGFFDDPGAVQFAPAPSPPIVLSLRRIVARGKTTGVAITFSDGDGVGGAGDSGRYRVKMAGRVVKLRSTGYDPTSHTAVLTLKQSIRGRKPITVEINGLVAGGSYTGQV